MKNFKQILNEFRIVQRGGGGDIPQEDPHKRIAEFMEKTPFTHVTTGEDEIHFHNSLQAAKLVASQRENHEDAIKYATSIKDEPMTNYFLSSSGTHDDVLDAIEDHVFNHPSFPSDLKPHLAGYFEKIEEIAGAKARSTNYLTSMTDPNAHPHQIGKVMHRLHSPKATDPKSKRENEHPHMYNDTHHLQGVIGILKQNPDDGYFLSREEK
jgi:hypothetical protein